MLYNLTSTTSDALICLPLKIVYCVSPPYNQDRTPYVCSICASTTSTSTNIPIGKQISSPQSPTPWRDVLYKHHQPIVCCATNVINKHWAKLCNDNDYINLQGQDTVHKICTLTSALSLSYTYHYYAIPKPSNLTV